MLKVSEKLKDLKTYYKHFNRFIECAMLLDKYYNKESITDHVDHDCMEAFIKNDLNNNYESFEKLYDAISEIKIKSSGFFLSQIRYFLTIS